jgi:predicted peptidase
MGSPEVETALQAVDFVIGRHRIDPARVYLTGYSLGGNGVWGLAEAFPDKWAAVAPVSGFTSPDVAKVRHLPAWLFHGALDTSAPVERERELARALREAGAEVRYTEVPGGNHFIGPVAYGDRELYDWFARQRRKD